VTRMTLSFTLKRELMSIVSSMMCDGRDGKDNRAGWRSSNKREYLTDVRATESRGRPTHPQPPWNPHSKIYLSG